MAGQQGQPKYGFGWPEGRLGGLGPPGQREARPLLEVFEFEAVILPCTGVGWREDVLRFNRRESVNNFEKKN